MDKIVLNIRDEYTYIPGVREEIEGDFPGEEFLAKHLLPKFKLALEKKTKLVVNLDGVAGYATSFLEASFGGLTREYKSPKIVLDTIEFESNEDPFLVSDILEYINDALNK